MFEMAAPFPVMFFVNRSPSGDLDWKVGPNWEVRKAFQRDCGRRGPVP